MSDGRSTIIPDLFHNTELLGVGLLLAVAKTRLQHRNWLAGAAWAPWPPQTDTGSAVLRLATSNDEDVTVTRTDFAGASAFQVG